MRATFAVGVRTLPLPRVRHRDPAEASHYIVLVPLTNIFQVHPQRFVHSGWQHRSPILLALAFTEQYLVAGDVHVLDAESQALQQAQVGTRAYCAPPRTPFSTCASMYPEYISNLLIYSGHIARMASEGQKCARAAVLERINKEDVRRRVTDCFYPYPGVYAQGKSSGGGEWQPTILTTWR
jgi:hypothetical protein